VDLGLEPATPCAAGAHAQVNWQVLVLLGSIQPLGLAMQNTGTAELAAAHFLEVTRAFISNTAAAVVLTPFALAMASSMGVSPMPFVIAVMLASSNSFMTPVGYQTNTFIYGPGGYRFSDFARVGGPLALLFAVTAALVIPIFLPF